MRTTLFLSLVFLFCAAPTLLCFGQYGGQYGGGYGAGGGYGRQNRGVDFKPTMPNVAGDMANRETKWLKENLALNKEQAKDVKTLNNDYAKLQQQALKEILGKEVTRPTEAQTKQIRDAMMMYNEEKEDKLKAIFTPDQWALYQSKKGDMQREIGGIRPAAPTSATTVN